ncbi:serine/threonine protein kinase [Allorhodopirellula solitaria]|uniref:Serine/threonine-protein kinase PknH n=1 Tax=Allorhodopirellula solitaria TaxID=2527987 RepID=A0A5C5XW09_9BACT|nr:serine/threonine-protein kinase [Allorhodopirellula solitaria]TWT67094.1 Serine/threonine-protein kinase PknH [Allorhodopirellula solitaria]
MPRLYLADFKLGSVLGVGTVGTIFDGHVRTDTEVSPSATGLAGQDLAIKILHPNVSSDELIQARFRREMLILERLEHPNIIGYFGGGSEDNQLFYVMQRVDGGTIKDLIVQSGSLSWPAVVDVARQVCSALQCAHNHGVIHRDLKPGNLFLTRDAEVKLGDFGIARDQHSADLTHQGLTVGTHAYMAPEQITGDEVISGKIDLYALGCCMFEMLSGQKVFLGENFAQLFEQHLRTPPRRISSLVPDVPRELDEIINRCLEKRPEDRPFNARAIQGVMLTIGEKYGLSQPPVASSPHAVAAKDREELAPEPHDVAAESVTGIGREQLAEQIRIRQQGDINPTVPAWKLALVAGLLILVLGIAALLAQR